MWFFMLISPCIVNQFLKMFQQDGTFCAVFYSPQTTLHVSGETFAHHQITYFNLKRASMSQ
jgi:hypothetical protein